VKQSKEVHSKGTVAVFVKINPLRLGLRLGTRTGDLAASPAELKQLASILFTLACREEQIAVGAVASDLVPDKPLVRLVGSTPN